MGLWGYETAVINNTLAQHMKIQAGQRRLISKPTKSLTNGSCQKGHMDHSLAPFFCSLLSSFYKQIPKTSFH